MKMLIGVVLLATLPMLGFASSPSHSATHSSKHASKAKLHNKNTVKLQKNLKQAVEPSLDAREKQLIQRGFAIKQMWALSNNYRYGVTVEKDPAKAYGWLKNYVAALPHDYPGTNAMLQSLQKNLNKQQLATGNKYFYQYRQRYGLRFRLQEHQLTEVFRLGQLLKRQGYFESADDSAITAGDEEITAASQQAAGIKHAQNNKSKAVTANNTLPDFVSVLEQLRANKHTADAEKLAQMMLQAQKMLARQQASHIIYGQVMVDGPEDPQMVASNIVIGPEGYFVAAIADHSVNLKFDLSGFRGMSLRIPDIDMELINVGKIVLEPLGKSQTAGLVGMVALPGIRPEPGYFVLRLLEPAPVAVATAADDAKQDAWYRPIIPVVVLPNGQFYAKGLSPAAYELTIHMPGKVIYSRRIDLQSGEIAQVDPIESLADATSKINHAEA